MTTRFDRDAQSPYAAVFLAIHDVVMSFEGVTEKRSPNITSYHFEGRGLCNVRVRRDGVEVGFLKGVRMQDIHFRLQGTGKYKRDLILREMDEDVLVYYIIQGLELNRSNRPFFG